MEVQSSNVEIAAASLTLKLFAGPQGCRLED